MIYHAERGSETARSLALLGSLAATDAEAAPGPPATDLPATAAG
ncbi:hypothetical protein GCM10027605_49660 [Micromonospora zhanjiangensis]